MSAFVKWLGVHNVIPVFIAFLLGLVMHDFIGVVVDDVLEPIIDSAIERRNMCHDIPFRDILKKLIHLVIILALIYATYIFFDVYDTHIDGGVAIALGSSDAM